ncbi:MAG: STAS domain-containing protein [Fervidobacterium sp.]|uniref:Anti-sigma factor antagonist n=1 Tax=Fervidobacterium gondwanense DSM 13020 TaxID=1121883 RepID=A0A1M7TCG6_FERGO|nr:STAS domain-containing protein [Fervidobacterium gondwanense]UXF01740.1 anti-sigma factor antagonist [Fervidobacterium riparium]SHN68459.1 anti-anti-sigma factor [Fervidobacterium gondwanense DSM 13020]
MYTFTEQFGVAVVALDGEINMQNAMSLRNWVVDNLIKKGKSKIVFDFAKVNSVDSFGLGTFVSLHKSALSANGVIAFAGPNENVKKLLAMTALDKVIRSYPSVMEAVNAIK